MNTNPKPTRTLGTVSASLVDTLLEHGKSIFTIDDIVDITQKTRKSVTDLLVSLDERGIITRIKSGKYIILESGRKSTLLSNWPIIARELYNSTNYYVSHYSAMRLHGMTTHSSNIIYITSPLRKRESKVGFMTYINIYSNPKHFWGFSPIWVNKQEKVNVSDLERTLLDCLDRPEYCGGVKEITLGLSAIRNEIDWDKLIKYAEKYRTNAAAKRLGILLEIIGIKNDYINVLNNVLSSSKDYILLDPHGSKEGKYISRWHVRVNLNINELKASI